MLYKKKRKQAYYPKLQEQFDGLNVVWYHTLVKRNGAVPRLGIGIRAMLQKQAR